MEQKAPQIEPQSQKASLHQSDADDDDENVKQLNECSSLYLSLQVFYFFYFFYFHFWSFILNPKPWTLFTLGLLWLIWRTFFFLSMICRIVLLKVIEIGSLARWVCVFLSLYSHSSPSSFFCFFFVGLISCLQVY